MQDKKMNILASRGRERRLKGEWGILQRPGDEPGLKEANMGGGLLHTKQHQFLHVIGRRSLPDGAGCAFVETRPLDGEDVVQVRVDEQYLGREYAGHIHFGQGHLLLRQRTLQLRTCHQQN